MGAVIMNGLARKIWKDMEEVAKLRTSDSRIMPIMEEATREYLYNGWVNAVRTVNKQ
jgi:glycerol kinase